MFLKKGFDRIIKDHKAVNRFATVLEVPMYYNGPISKGDVLFKFDEIGVFAFIRVLICNNYISLFYEKMCLLGDFRILLPVSLSGKRYRQ